MERMKSDHEKRLRDAIERARAKILNKGSSDGTNDAVPDLSMPIPISESLNDKNTVIPEIQHEDKDREEE